MTLSRIKFGDIFEIKTSKGFGYFQYINETPNRGEVIRVFGGIFFNKEDANLESLINKKELYFLHFPLKAAIKKKCVRPVGNFNIPSEVVVPRYYRTKEMVKGEFLGWYIVDRETWKRRLTQELSNEELLMSPWGSWNDTLLAERIASGWTLEDWI